MFCGYSNLIQRLVFFSICHVQIGNLIIAQLLSVFMPYSSVVERLAVNQCVVGSSPTGAVYWAIAKR